jgi:hypothetical protein
MIEIETAQKYDRLAAAGVRARDHAGTVSALANPHERADISDVRYGGPGCGFRHANEVPSGSSMSPDWRTCDR